MLAHLSSVRRFLFMTELSRVPLRIMSAAGSSSSANSPKFTNRLSKERSPYLLQHQHNPVDWYPWGAEAFARARELNRPIFLSVGYSTCHWCHVMEHESFENEAIALILNTHFVSVKVDREERPDVDRLYMSFIQAMSGHGGWPMSVFLTPDLHPITGGTYFPPEDRYGQMGFPSVLRLIADKWANSREGVERQGRAMADALRQASASRTKEEVPSVAELAKTAFKHLHSRFDERHAGFGDAPKFPKPVDLDFLLKLSFTGKELRKEERERARYMVSRTLDAMARGGIHDHVGKGFHRYSVDAGWHVPHFEKMVYDQAQLLALYSDFSRISNGEHRATIEDIVDYVRENLTHPEGGFFSAEDADSFPEEGAKEKREGAFCVWTKAEFDSVLQGKTIEDKSLVDVAAYYFGVEPQGNAPPYTDPHDELKNQNILIMHHTHAEVAKKFGITEEQLTSGIEEAKSLLCARRSLRPKPHKDTKIVTAWQGLMLSGLAKASRALKREDLVEMALRNVEFIKKKLQDVDGRLLRAVYTGDDGQIQQIAQPIHAFADDYCFLIEGLLELYLSVPNRLDLVQWAAHLQSELDTHFWDEAKSTGYFLSRNDSEKANDGVFCRSMEDQDGAEPSPNSVAVSNLARLAELTGRDSYSKRARDILKGSSQILSKYAFVLARMVAAAERLERSPPQIVIVGDDETSTEFLAEIAERYLPHVCLIHLKKSDDESWLVRTNPHLSALLEVPRSTAFICREFTCGLPITNVEKLRKALDELSEISQPLS